MWTAEHTILTNLPARAIWNTWADIENWPRWDRGLEWCKTEGAFQAGTTYTLKPVGGPEVRAEITECQPLRRFADVTRLPLATMEFSHELTESQEGLRVTHRVRIWGPLGFVFAQLIGKDAARDLPATMRQLVETAQEAA